ncbi:hypothetical protein CSKR_113614 [Clonorchis sinensis]|uniref:Uncharacterized protein n=1 Tax=Clonorchis sinensis TaxID=79923 RepID=A0A3R7JZ75_CLOSI|nr:hypothetical protein CSKR_113614 [Clonorchis sinensis]
MSLIEYAALNLPHVSFWTICMDEPTHKFAGISPTANDPFRHFWGSSSRHSPQVSINVMLDLNSNCTKFAHYTQAHTSLILTRASTESYLNECASQGLPRISVGTIFRMSQYIVQTEHATYKVAKSLLQLTVGLII